MENVCTSCGRDIEKTRTDRDIVWFHKCLGCDRKYCRACEKPLPIDQQKICPKCGQVLIEKFIKYQDITSLGTPITQSEIQKHYDEDFA